MSSRGSEFGGNAVEHFDEMAGLLFLEGQLDAAESARVSAHAARCSDCRRLLGALEHESHWLGKALREETEALPARLLRAPFVQTWRAAPWVWALSFGLAGAAIYAAWVTILTPWLDQLESVGMGSTDLAATIFFSGAFWEGWSAMIDTLQYTLLAGLVAGVMVLLRGRSHRWLTSTAAAIATMLLLGMAGPAKAADIRHGAAVSVAEGETLHNDLVAAGNSVRVDGTVDGDVIAFTPSLSVNGHVTGDVIAFARDVRISGPVDGNVRCFCAIVSLEGPVGKNATLFAGQAEIEPKSSVGGGVIAFAANVVLDGKVMRDLLFFTRTTTLDGSVGGNILLRGGNFSIGRSAQIGGSTRVIGDRRPEVAPGATLASPLQFEYRARRRGFRSPGAIAVRAILGYAGAFLFGLLLIAVLPGLFSAGVRATRQAGLAMGVGVIVLICGFALVFLSVFLLLAGIGAGVATVFLYAPLIYSAQVFVGTWIGEKLRGSVAAPRAMLGRLALGLLVLRVVELIPVLGGLIWIAATIWGTGALCMALWELLRPEANPAMQSA